MRMLEGAREAELDDLRRYGYDPEPHQSSLGSRLDWERSSPIYLRVIRSPETSYECGCRHEK
jgi:hypothetical protein